jgi:hypothetical protein
MPTSKRPAATKPASSRTATDGINALKGLEVSLDEAEKALTELRRDLSSGGRRLVKDVETAVKNARRDLARTRTAIQSDLGDLGDALTPRRARKTPAKKPAARATPARSSKPVGAA